MVYFKAIEPTEHYLREHAHDVPWAEVVEITKTSLIPDLKVGVFNREVFGITNCGVFDPAQFEIIFTAKSPRKKGDKFEIENDQYYILFEIKDDTLYVINAKRT